VLAVRTLRKEVVAQLPWWGLPWWVPVLVRRLIVIALVGILLLVAIWILTSGRLP
jgi:hypothetical protein